MPRVKKLTADRLQTTAGKTAVSRSRKADSLTVPVYTLDGKESGMLGLPKELFGAKVNKVLLAQAVRVYMSNLKGHFSNTKTRSEVKGSTRKIYKQKGTGGARHGAKSAPIFVGGGIALGPKFRKVVLELPKKMKRAALSSALSSKMADKEVIGIKGLEKASGKTAQIRELLQKIGKRQVLFILDGKDENVSRAVGNLTGVNMLMADQVNILEIIKHQTLALTEEAVKSLELRVKNEGVKKEEKK